MNANNYELFLYQKVIATCDMNKLSDNGKAIFDRIEELKSNGAVCFSFNEKEEEDEEAHNESTEHKKLERCLGLDDTAEYYKKIGIVFKDDSIEWYIESPAPQNKADAFFNETPDAYMSGIIEETPESQQPQSPMILDTTFIKRKSSTEEEYKYLTQCLLQRRYNYTTNYELNKHKHYLN